MKLEFYLVKSERVSQCVSSYLWPTKLVVRVTGLSVTLKNYSRSRDKNYNSERISKFLLPRPLVYDIQTFLKTTFASRQSIDD